MHNVIFQVFKILSRVNKIAYKILNQKAFFFFCSIALALISIFAHHFWAFDSSTPEWLFLMIKMHSGLSGHNGPGLLGCEVEIVALSLTDNGKHFNKNLE